jgi:hypothetical protein
MHLILLESGDFIGMAQENSFKNLAIDSSLVEGSLQELGIVGLKAVNKTDKHTMFTGCLSGENFALNLFKNSNGLCTLGKASGFSVAAFESAANHIKQKCAYAEKGKLEFSIAVDPLHPQAVVDFLVSEEATVEEYLELPIHKQWRIKGVRGDSIVLKFFPSTGTLQAQGPNAHLAAMFFDFTCNVLGHQEAINKHRQIYKINLTTEQVNTELKTKIPAVHDYLEEVTRKQFSCAYAFTKIGIELEDYSGLTFYALRGLEGFCFQILKSECNLRPEAGVNLGSYFERLTSGKYRMLPVYSSGQNAYVVSMLDEAYNLWYTQRHGAFHMDPGITSTRIIKSREAAVEITDSVFELINSKYLKYIESK